MRDAGGLAAGTEQTLPADHEGVAGSDVGAELALIAARRYRILGELARGGGGRILRALDLAFDRIVAIKEPLEPGHGGPRLRAEAAILAALQHPSIVPIYDHGTRLDGAPFFAMKLVDGHSLREAIAGAPTLEQRLALLPHVVAVAEAVAYAHAQGVIHRDLKPANVLCGRFGETIVIDWGVARTLGARGPERADEDGAPPAARAVLPATTTTGAIVGTPAYMAPEQARGEQTDERADVYALGALLYHVLAGVPPFAGTAAVDALVAVRAGAPPPIEERQQRVPADLAAIVGKAMAREPDDRYPTAAGFAEDLVRFETGRLVAARRYSLVARARRLLRARAPWFAAAGLAVASAALAFALAPRSAARSPAADCALAGEQVERVWNPGRRQALLAAFAAAGVPHAARISDELVGDVDRAAGGLAAARIEACRARARGEQSEARLDARMGCLDQQLAQLDATLAALSSPDGALVDEALRVVEALDDPAVCSDAEALSLAPPEPVEPAARAALGRLRERLAATQTAITLRRWDEAAGALPALVDEAARLGYCPVDVEARLQLAIARAYVRRNRDETVAAAAGLRDAILAADACGIDRARARALTVLVDIGDANDVDGRRRVADELAAVSRRVDDPELQIRIRAVTAVAAYEAGDLTRALALSEEALALASGTPSHARALLEANLAVLLLEAGDLERALALAERGVAELRRLHGSEHRIVAKSEVLSLAAVYAARGEPARAEATIARAVDVLTRTLGPEHKDVLRCRGHHGEALVDLGRFAEAAVMLEHDHPVAVRVVGADHETAVQLQAFLVRAYRGLGRFDEALAMARAVLAVRLRTVGAGHPQTARARVSLGEVLGDLGRHPEAVAELRAAHAIHARLGGLEHRDGAAAELALAAALWDAGGDHREARALATAAQARAGALPSLRERAASWLREHPAS